MSGIAVGASLIIGGFLSVSAAAKAIHPSAAAAALIELGLQRRTAHLCVAMGVVLEVGIAAVIVLWPRAPEAEAACVALFGAFAFVAALALRSGRSIECGCLGSLHRSTLGWTQVVQFALVMPSMIMVGSFAPVLSIRTGLELLFAVQVAASALMLGHVFQAWWQIRRDRISLGAVQAYVRRAGWPEISVLEGEGGSP
jgi:methylamine utilization protein MauE